MSKKVVLFSTGDINGAYEMIYRIADFLVQDNYEVAMLVKLKTRSDSFIIEVPTPFKIPTFKEKILNRLNLKIKNLKNSKASGKPTDPKYLFLEEDETINFYTEYDILGKMPFVPDIIISGMTNGFINSPVLSKIQKVTGAKTFTLMVDMFPITGGCHYAWDCTGYQRECENCPAILNPVDKDWPHKNLLIKKENYSKSNIKVLAASGWTQNQARTSTLFKNQKNIFSVNSCIDMEIFNNRSRNSAKTIFGIPPDSKLIFAGSQNVLDERKGIKYFLEALNILWNTLDDSIKSNTYILIIGRYNASDEWKKVPFKMYVIDYLKDYRLLSLAYQASDIFVCPSIEDSGPMMVSEALSCGTPVVGFDMGVVHNMVVTGFNGYKAKLKDSLDLVKGLKSVLMLNDNEFNTYSQNAVSQVEKFSSNAQVLRVIKEIIEDN